LDASAAFGRISLQGVRPGSNSGQDFLQKLGGSGQGAEEIDLVEAGASRNPYFQEAVRNTQVVLFETA